jgi:DNA adenine methylase
MDGHYVEPYAGGSSVALSLLFNEYTLVAHINDYDYNVYCFWDSAVNHTHELCELIDQTPVDMPTWRRQKEIQLNPGNYSKLQVGYSTFFLNRANRSGILNAGVIGGIDQTGEWKIDARFNKEELISRIRRVGRYRDRIKVYNKDAIDLVKDLRGKTPAKTFFYFDPPYYNKGKDLYINFYNHEDHAKIATVIATLRDKYWLVSYDNDPHISGLYQQFRQQTYDLNYHAAIASKGTEVLIFSDRMVIPKMKDPVNKKELKFFSMHGLFADWDPALDKQSEPELPVGK